VPTVPNTQLIQFEDWTLRVRKSNSRNPRLLLLIHGITGDENSMWVFARDLPVDYWIIAPRAPYNADPNGYSWRLPQYNSMDGPSLEQLRQGAKELIHLIDAYAASVEVNASTFDVIGFSQGAAMSNVLTFLYPQKIRKIGILSGFVPSGLEELISQRPLEGKSFFVAHGSKDDMVKVERARASIALLEQAGATVTYCEDDVAHKVSLNCLRALKEFLSD
jgi:phospholipase/carboxylesterase